MSEKRPLPLGPAAPVPGPIHYAVPRDEVLRDPRRYSAGAGDWWHSAEPISAMGRMREPV